MQLPWAALTFVSLCSSKTTITVMTLECVAPTTCDGGRQVGRRELEIVSRRSEGLRPTQPESRLATRPLQRQVAMLPRGKLSFPKSPLLLCAQKRAVKWLQNPVRRGGSCGIEGRADR